MSSTPSIPSSNSRQMNSNHGLTYRLVVIFVVMAALCLSSVSVVSFSRSLRYSFQQRNQEPMGQQPSGDNNEQLESLQAKVRLLLKEQEEKSTASQQEIDQLKTQVKSLRDEATEEANKGAQSLQKQVHELQSEVQTLEKEKNQLANKLTALEEQAETTTSKEVNDDTPAQNPTVGTNVLRNLHENFPMTCGQLPDPNTMHPAIEPLTDLYWNDLGPTPGYRKYMYVEGQDAHGLKGGLEGVLKTQVCLYDVLHKWRALADRLGITRWAVHGGSAISAQCYGAINPWDDDIDMTVTNCQALNEVYDQGTDPFEKYPDIPKSHIMHTRKPHWYPRLIDNDNLILIKGYNDTSWYKLMTVQHAYLPAGSIMGMDIECMDRSVSYREVKPKQQAGWTQYLLSDDKPLDDVMYGPTKIQMLPAQIHQDYVRLRYRKESPCRYPFHHGVSPEPFNVHKDGTRSSATHGDQVYLPDIQAASIDTAIAKWYVPKNQRTQWLEKVGDGKQNDYTSQIPNLDDVEVDNSISPQGCEWTNNTIKVIGWNAERGKHWDKFVSLVQELDDLKEPYVVLLNEMDLGMARTQNVHTARRLALQLGMNYAYGVEFLELTRGNQQEQNATDGLRDALGLHGNAILTKCILGDAMTMRDPLPKEYFMDKPHWMNGKGCEKRLGGRGGIFARIYQSMPTQMNLYYHNKEERVAQQEEAHFVVGNVHKMDEKSARNRQALWEYFAFGSPSGSLYEGIGENPGNQLGVVIQGDIMPELCPLSGLNRLGGKQHRTFPVKSCAKGNVKIGNSASDMFCSNMNMKRDVIVTPPCWYGGEKQEEAGFIMADHAIVSVELQGKAL